MSEFGGGSEVSDTGEGNQDGVVGREPIVPGNSLSLRARQSIMGGVVEGGGVTPADSAPVTGESDVSEEKTTGVSGASQASTEKPLEKQLPLGQSGRKAMQGF